MRYIEVALLLVLSVGYAACSNQKMAHRKHLKHLKHFPCSEPQPRVFELEDVVPDHILKDKYGGLRESIKPPVTILHRCFSAGCCENSDERCLPSRKENVTLSFAVLHARSEFFEVIATNHTECSCMPMDVNSIK